MIKEETGENEGIQLPQEELWAFNMLNSSTQEGQAELNRRIQARNAYLKLLEGKYDATFDPDSGQLKPNKKE